MRTINHESDFKIIEGFKDGSSILEAPFRFTYYTKVTRGVYVAEYNGSEFINCHPTDDGRVVVPFDSPKLGMGVLMVKREFFLSDSDFKDGICNLVSIESAGIMLDRGATDMYGEVNIELFPFYQQGETGKSAYQEWLDLGNEGTTADFIASLRGAAFTYEDFTEEQLAALKGEKGDKMTYDDLTEEEKEDLAKKVIGNAEDERRAAEIVRQENEATREEQEAKRIETFNTNESQREDAFITAQSQMAQDFQESQTRRSNTFTANEDSRQKTANASEASRKQTFETNEQERQSIFTANESERRIAETGRQAREDMRVTAENSRESAENQRRLAEIGREETFAANETQREQTFETNEAERQSTFAANEVLRQEAEAVREANEKRREETYNSKVDKDDNAPKLTAGFANNLVGRGEATEEEISFRPSGGDTSIEDGTARIERLKGNTVVWNQLVRDANSLADNYSITAGHMILNYNQAHVDKGWIQLHSTRVNNMSSKKLLAVVSHPKIRVGDACTYGSSSAGYSYNYRFISTSLSTIMLGLIPDTDLAFGTYEFDISLHNLTQMFGAGNEPTTIEEFNARKPIGIDEYAYNEGELISTNVDEVKSVGFNAWDEEWEVGKISGGNNSASQYSIRSKGYIPVVGGASYYFGTTRTGVEGYYINVYTYDDSYNYLGTIVNGVYAGTSTTNANYNNPFTLEKSVRYIRFVTTDRYGDVYKNDICIHLVHTGYRNGEYEPYKEFRRSIPISEIKDSDGNQLFPLGLLSAGSVYDEITATKAIKRIGVVDMGNLGWYGRSSIDSTGQSIYMFSVYLDGVKKPSYGKFANAINPTHTIVASRALNDSVFNNKTYRIYTDGIIYLRDDDYTSGASFQSAMSGVLLYYELATPIEVDLPEPLNLDYEVSDFGTEEVISDVPTTPLKADIIYQFNAVDRIRDNSRHTAEAEIKLKDYQTRIKSLEDIVAALTQQTPSGEEVINQG